MGFVIYWISYIPVLYWWLREAGRTPQWAFLAGIPIFSLIFAFYPTSNRKEKEGVQKLGPSVESSQRVMRYGSFKDRESDSFR